MAPEGDVGDEGDAEVHQFGQPSDRDGQGARLLRAGVGGASGPAAGHEGLRRRGEEEILRLPRWGREEVRKDETMHGFPPFIYLLHLRRASKFRRAGHLCVRICIHQVASNPSKAPIMGFEINSI